MKVKHLKNAVVSKVPADFQEPEKGGDAVQLERRGELLRLSSQPEFQRKVLRTILTTEPGREGGVVGNRELIKGHLPGDTLDYNQKCYVMWGARRALTEGIVGVMNEVFGEVKDHGLVVNRLLVAQLRVPSGVSQSDFVSRTRELVSRLEDVRTRLEDTLAERVAGRINDRFFDGEEVCGKQFGVRLVRLGLYGEERYALHPGYPTPQTLDEVKAQLNAYAERKVLFTLDEGTKAVDVALALKRSGNDEIAGVITADSVLGRLDNEQWVISKGGETLMALTYVPSTERLEISASGNKVSLNARVREGKLNAYSKGEPRPIERMSSDELNKGILGFLRLVARKLSEGPKGELPLREVAKSVRFILAGDEGVEYITNWRLKEERKAAFEWLCKRANGDPLSISIRELLDKYHALALYYLRKSEGRTKETSFAEALLMMLEEFGVRVTPQQRMGLLTKHNPQLQKALILKHFNPGRPREDYEVLGMSKDVVRTAMIALTEELTAHVAEGRTPVEIADVYGVGARGLSRILQSCTLEGDAATGVGRRVVVKAADGHLVKSSNEPLPASWDMYSLEDLGSMLVDYSRLLQGIPKGRKTPPGPVERNPVLNPLEEDVRGLIKACDKKDLEGILALAERLGQHVNEAGQRPIDERYVTVFVKTVKSTKYLKDDDVRKLSNISSSLIEEVKFRQSQQ